MIYQHDEEEDEDEWEEIPTCNCVICPWECDVQSFGDVCMNCSSGEHLG